jgi:prefoldin subunit 5
VAENVTALIQALTERQQTTERQLSELSAAFKALEAKLAALGQPAAALAQTKKPEITPELLVMLAAAATAYLGKEVRVRSAKMLQSPYEVVNPWAQQGRVFIQAAHNLRPRR